MPIMLPNEQCQNTEGFRVGWYCNGKTEINLDFLGQKIMSCGGIRWTIWKFAPYIRQITMPESHHSDYVI